MPAENYFRCGRHWSYSRDNWEIVWALGVRRDLAPEYMQAPAKFWIIVHLEKLPWRLRINGAWYFRPILPFRIRLHWGSDRKLIKEKTAQP